MKTSVPTFPHLLPSCLPWSSSPACFNTADGRNRGTRKRYNHLSPQPSSSSQSEWQRRRIRNNNNWIEEDDRWLINVSVFYYILMIDASAILRSNRKPERNYFLWSCQSRTGNLWITKSSRKVNYGHYYNRIKRKLKGSKREWKRIRI